MGGEDGVNFFAEESEVIRSWGRACGSRGRGEGSGEEDKSAEEVTIHGRSASKGEPLE
jgi:hypothetical protein